MGTHCISFCVVCSLVDRKRHSLLVEAIALLAQDRHSITEKAKLLESGASLSQTPRAGTARLGSENSWKRALARLSSDFVGAAWFYLLVHICHIVFFSSYDETKYLPTISYF